jgi:hypothetical protein
MASISNARLAGEGVAAGLVGGAVAHLLWVAATSGGVPTAVTVPGQGPVAVTWVNFAVVGVVSGLGAALVALLLDGRRRARTLFVGVSGLVLAASLLPLTSQPDGVATATRAVLAAGHLIVFAAVVPRLAGRLRGR